MKLRIVIAVLVTLIVLIVVGIYKEKSYFEDSVKITVKSSLADCEKWNLFLEVESVYLEKCKHYEGQYILPVCKSKKCEDLLYSINHFDTARTFVLIGKFSKKPHKSIDYGCPNAHSFKIEQVLELSGD